MKASSQTPHNLSSVAQGPEATRARGFLPVRVADLCEDGQSASFRANALQETWCVPRYGGEEPGTVVKME